MPRDPEYEGEKFTIRCVELADGSCPAGDFLDGLDESDRTKVDVIFELLAEQGKLTNPTKFKKVEGSDKIFEIKSHQIRIFCFFAPNWRLMLAFGVIKQTDRHKKADIRRAEGIKNWFFSQEEGVT